MRPARDIRNQRLSTIVMLLALFAATPRSTEANTPKQGSGPPTTAVLAFIAQDYAHGLPYEQTKQLGPGAIPVLKALLEDPALKHHWYKCATALAMIGGVQEYEYLKNFVWQRFTGQVDQSTYLALVAAHGGLGYIANTTRAPQVLAYLQESADPQFWSTLPWSDANSPPPPHGTSLQFAELSVTGLGLSGDTEALIVIERLQAASESGDLRRVAQYSARINRTIAAVGIARYLREFRHARTNEMKSRDER